ncbi:type-F conjugative transfer system pilin assembly protein TrbC [Vibrio tapetis subsp. quintayensis]|uniref:type-F conjugative transfer system pilin assembly protein TrbC n=1 Tax=Vibrio tapetis TaxID=52443 RepID=UPI0025B61E9D|nr:type-F conjugative transfer system pilin assembly protein TrbC [Vibrio tapetis]MDN3683142.1 type-F conjugative transfer system pilin assembly protein TrbC [Vibrio tapetis subsp. quintayensis]
MRPRLLRKACCFALWACALTSPLTHAYTKEELQAFQDIERRLAEHPDAAIMAQSKTLHDQARAHRSEAQQASKAAGLKLTPQSLSPLLDTLSAQTNPEQAPKGVMVFVSLTMPNTALTQLLKQSERTGIPLVIRGVLPQGFTATVTRIQTLINQGNRPAIRSGFSISPDWFRQFDIQQVPTFVSIKPGQCQPKQSCLPTDYDVVTGNISLYQALETLAQGDTQQEVATLLRALEH